MINKVVKVIFIAATLGLAAAAHSATEWSAQDYDLYPGDFDGDGKTDILYIAKDSAKPSGIAKSDGAGPNISWQSWPSNYLGIQWYGNAYGAVIGDFNHDGKSDVFLQKATAGDNYLLLTDSSGRISGITQTISSTHLGLTWSYDQHSILAGDFNGDGRSDLFFQAATASGTHAVVFADSSGTFTVGPTQTWTDSSWSAFKWSRANAVLSVGDFNGDSRADLIIQAKPKIVLIDYEISIPIPVYSPNSFGVVIAQAGTSPFAQSGVQQWSRNANGVDWSPSFSTVVVGDFNGDGRIDVLLQAKSADKQSYLLTGNAGGAAFSLSTAVASNVAINGDAARLLAANFDGTPGAGIYVQSTSGSGSNYVANSVSASISASWHNPSSVSGTTVATAVGATAGAFDVSHSGAASYRIPIVVPPGIKGVQPNLAFVYSSHVQNSWAGMGWTVSGFSQIARCAATAGQDGFDGAVGLNIYDRFCLDGNKLRITNAPTYTYGAAGSTYATELETFSRATAYGTAGTDFQGSSAGPAYFIVERKDGLRYEYGNSSDSSVEAVVGGVLTTTPRAWLLNKVTDRNGNVMTFTYQEDSNEYGSVRPIEINYTSNILAGVSSAFKVKLYWEARPSAIDWIVSNSGSQVRETKRLDRIETYYGTSLVRKYELSYQIGMTSRSRLSAIQECAGDGTCLPASTFGWQDGKNSWLPELTVSTPGFDADSARTQHVLDFDGDGKTDIIYAAVTGSTRRWYKLISNGTGFETAAETGAGAGVQVLLDYTLFVPASPNGGATTIQQPPGAPFRFSDKDWLADIDNDGRTEIIESWTSGSQTNFYKYEGYSGAQFTLPVANYYNPFIRYQRDGIERFHDFNGDGKSDLIGERAETQTICSGGEGMPVECYQATSFGWAVLQSTSTPSYTVAVSVPAPSCEFNPCDRSMLMPGDYNGDRYSDLITNGEVRYGSPSGLSAPESLAASAGIETGVPGDVDGDGRADLLYKDYSSSAWKLLRWNGNGFDSSAFSAIPSGATEVRIADFNADGLPDLSYVLSGALKVRLHEGPEPDLMTSATDGFGNQISVLYASPSDSTVYSANPTASTITDELDTVSPSPLVKSYSVMGGGTAYTITERYVGARKHRGYRGFLGFAGREETDGRTNAIRHWDFLHRNAAVSSDFATMNFPVTGRPSREWITHGSNVVSDTQHTYKLLFDGQTYGVGQLSLTYTPPEDPSQYVLPYLRNGPNAISTRAFPYVQESVQTVYEAGGNLAGQPITEVTSTIESIDSFGAVLIVKNKKKDIQSGSPWNGQSAFTRVTNSVTNDQSNWCLGVSDRTTTAITLLDGTSRSNVVARTIDYVKCRATDELSEPDVSGSPTSLSVKAHYVFDTAACGNPSAVEITGYRAAGTALPTRTTSYGYGARCAVTETITDAMSKSTYYTYDYAHGVPKTKQDPNDYQNGRQTVWDYDAFGRKKKETRPDLTSSTLDYEACNLANSYCGVADLRMRVTSALRDTAGNAIRTSFEYYDSLGRIRIEDEPLPVSGALSHVVSTYDSLGRLETRTAPYTTAYQGKAIHSYDLRGRQLSSKLYDAAGVLVREGYTRYEGRSTISKDPRTNETTRMTDVDGQLRRVYDQGVSLSANCGAGPMCYSYTFSGTNLVTTVTDKVGNSSVTTTNLIGNKIESQDPDMGTWTFQHTSLGELTKEVDAKSQQLTFDDYDALGRPTVRHEVEGDTYFTYGTVAQNAYGQLKSMSSGGYTETYDFDTYSRPVATHVQIPGEPQYDIDHSYNATTGLLETTTYPVSTSSTRLKVKYAYSQGVQTSVQDFTNNVSGATYWQLTATDAWGFSTNEQLGNGVRVVSGYDPTTGLMLSRQSGTDSVASNRQNLSYRWDANGNLERRIDSNQAGLYERFEYDELNRLKDSYRVDASTTTNNLHLTYSAIGNIESKSDVGTYNYSTAQSACTYSFSHSQPHAVRNAGGNSYCYDANGNMTSRPGTSITWYSDNSVKKITQGSLSSEFWYAPDGSRYKQLASYATGTETTYYVGGLMEKVVLASGTAYRHYITAGNNAVIHTRWSTGSTQTYYATSDNLGSTNSVTDQAGTVVVTESFDAFGKRRGTNWTGVPSSPEMQAIANSTRNGFTGHEHLDNLGLIHMNGRVQDPTLGRFISADPMIQAPDFTQSLNRYSYVWNNPLSMTDPTGYMAGGSGPDCTGSSTVGGHGDCPDLTEVVVTAQRIQPQLPEIVVTGDRIRTGRIEPIQITFGGDNGRDPSVFQRVLNFALEEALSPINDGIQLYNDVKDGNYLGALLAVGKMACHIAKGCRVVEKIGERFFGKAIGKLVDKVKSIGGCCFVAGTMVATSAGAVPIETIRIGDTVLSRDENTGVTEEKPVIDIYVNDEHSVWELAIANAKGAVSVHRVTGNHPYWTGELEWVAVENLRIGEHLTTESNELATVVSKHDTGVVVRTYNLEVADFHTYFIGDQLVLVHNGKTCNIGSRIPNGELKAPPPKRGLAPIGKDGKPVELHHNGQKNDSKLDEMTRTDHRGGGNFKRNHENTGQSESNIDRNEARQIREQHWRQEWDSGRFDDF